MRFDRRQSQKFKGLNLQLREVRGRGGGVLMVSGNALSAVSKASTYAANSSLMRAESHI